MYCSHCAYGESNKSTTSGTTSHRQVVSWESLGNFDDISVVYKSTDHGKLLQICFFAIILQYSRKITCTRKRTTNCPTNISFPCSDSYRPYSSWPISVWKIIQLWQRHMLKAKMKFRIKWFKPVLILNFLCTLSLILYCMIINSYRIRNQMKVRITQH